MSYIGKSVQLAVKLTFNAKNGLTLKVPRNAQWLGLNLWSKFILLDVFLEANIVMVTSLNPMEMQVILE